MKKVRVIINPNSGIGTSLTRIGGALLKYWDLPGTDLSFQFSKSKEDGQNKVNRLIKEGIDTLLVVGGDGMINSIGCLLIGTDISLGVIPTGSGNGFARHFAIPINPVKAVAVLAEAKSEPIDVGFANDYPFFVTCSLAWDAALVKTFEKSPVRGILPYVFSAVYEFFGYSTQPFKFILNNDEKFEIDDPQLCTIANLTQYGGGAQIAPGAKANDGKLQLVTVRRRDFPLVVPMIGKMFDGTLDKLQKIDTRSFETLTVRRKNAGPMQLDGELLEATEEINIRVEPSALNVLVPA